MMKARDMGIQLPDIINAVVGYLDVPADLLISDTRQQEVVYARQLISHLALLAGFKPPEICVGIGRDRCTIYIGSDVIENEKRIYQKVRRDVMNLSNVIIAKKFNWGIKEQ